MTYFLGIDVSTTATKALLINEAGNPVGLASYEYTFDIPHPLWSEQDPELWWLGTIHGIRTVLAKTGIKSSEVGGIGLTGQMHGLVLLNKNGVILRPAILWNDQRTATQCDQIRHRIGRTRLIQVTGNDALTGFTAPKILWVQENEPEVYRQASHILLPKDYVRWKLTGAFAMDCADGSGTILFDLKQRDWSQEILQALDIDHAWLPPLFEGPQVAGTLSGDVAAETGLLAGIPVVAGGGDQSAAAVGTGAVEEGIVSISLGTSGVVFATFDKPSIEPEGRLHAFCHALPNKWHMMGVMLSAGGSLRWFRDTFTTGMDYDALLQTAEEVPAGSDGLLFLPYLTGERTPHPDPLARGAFIGLTVRHGIPHMARSVLEGVAFGLRDSFELLKSSGLNVVTQVRVTGGGAQSTLWRQILADVLSTEVVRVNSEEGAAYGAALLAATANGVFPNVEAACHNVIRITDRVKPSQNAGNYQAIYPIFKSLYPELRSTFHQLAT